MVFLKDVLTFFKIESVLLPSVLHIGIVIRIYKSLIVSLRLLGRLLFFRYNSVFTNPPLCISGRL